MVKLLSLTVESQISDIVQVGNASCTVHPDFEEEIKQCFDAYSSTIEDKNPFGKMEGTA